MSDSARTLMLDGQAYWIGLVWRSIETENRSAVADLSRELDARFGVSVENRAAGTISIGFLLDHAGKDRLPSLAATLAASVDRDTLIIEQTGDEQSPLWLCCIRDGMIWPGTDRAGSVEDIASQARDLIALGGNPLVLAGSGASIALPSAEPAPLPTIEKTHIKAAMVGRLGGVQRKQVLILAGLIGAAVGGYFWWAASGTGNAQVQAQQEIAKRRAVAEQAMTTWVATIQSQPVLGTVGRMLATVNRPEVWRVPGWRVSSVLCTQSDCQVSWAREGGDPSDLVLQSGIDGVRLELTGQAATAVLVLSDLGVGVNRKARQTTTDLPPVNVALARLLDIQADLIRIGARMEVQSAAPAPVPDIALLPPERQVQSGFWKASGTGETLMSAGHLLDVPFTSAKSLMLSFDDHQEVSWTLEGMYVLR